MKNKLLNIKAELIITAYNPEKHHIPYILLAVDDFLLAASDIEFNDLFLEQVKCKIGFQKPKTSTRPSIVETRSKITVANSKQYPIWTTVIL